MFEQLVWHDDRFELGGFSFLLGQHRRDKMGGGDTGFIFGKGPRLLDQYQALWGTNPPPPQSHILELGINDGASAAFWSMILRPSRFATLDLASWEDTPYFNHWLKSPACESQVTTHWKTNQADANRLREIVAEDLDGRLDYVFGDASHLYEPSKVSFETLFPLLRPGGQYIIEDWSWGCWPNLPDDFPLPRGSELHPLVAEIAVAAGRMAGFLVGSGPKNTLAPFIARVTILADIAVVERGPADASKVPNFTLDTYITRRK